MSNDLVRKTGIYFIGNMASKMTMALIIPIYAFFVDVESLGEYDYLVTLMQMATPLLFFAIWESILRFVLLEGDSAERQSGISNAIAIALIAIVLIATLAVIAYYLELLSLENATIVAVMAILYGIVQVWQYLARALRESKLYSFSGACGAVVNFAAILLFVCVLRLQLEGLVLAYASGQFSILLIIESKLHLLREFKIRAVNRETVAKFLKFSMPLSVNLLLLTFMAGIGRILITNVLGAECNGLYTFAMKFAAIITTIGSIFAMAVVEEAIVRIGKPGASDFFKMVMLNSSSLLISLSCVCLPAIKVFYFFIQGSAYEESFCLVPILVGYAVCAVLGTIAGCVFQTLQKTNYIAATSFAGASVTTIGSLLFVRLGVSVVAIALLAGTFVMLAMRHAIGRRFVPYPLITLRNMLQVTCFIAISWILVVLIPADAIVSQLLVLIASTICFAPIAIRAYCQLTAIPDV